MKRTLLPAVALLLLVNSRSIGQEAAAGGQAAAPADAGTAPAPAPAAAQPPPPSPVPTNPPSGLLTPPADNAPTPAPSAATTPAATTTPTPAPMDAATPTASTPVISKQMSTHELRQIQKDEIIRRQELIYRADQSLKAARKEEVSQQFPEARRDYLFAAQAYSSVSRATNSYATAAEGLTRVDFELFADALKTADTARAKRLMDEVLKFNPNNKLAQEKELAIDRAINDPNNTTMLGNPAVTPAFVKKVTEVQRLFDEAEQFRRTGQWDEAEARLKRIIGIDPYNVTAPKQLDRITAEKSEYDEHARLETRNERLRQVEEQWYEPIINKDASSSAQSQQAPIIRATNFGIDQKLKDIFLSLDFNSATIEEATNFLSIESKRLDPEKKGVNFVIQPEASSSAKPVSITLNNIPLGEALRYVCQLANVKYKVQDYAISIVPFSQNTDDLLSRTFIVQPNFVVPPASTAAIESATSSIINGAGSRVAPVTPVAGLSTETDNDTVRKALTAKGVKFPPGASAVYTPATGQLTVVNTADQMELLEELVNAGQAPTLMVRIATKFIEINQTDVNDLTINSAFNLFSPAGVFGTPGRVFNNLIKGSSYQTFLPGSGGFSPNSIDQLISPASTTLNTFFFRGMISAQQYNIVVTALAQKKSFDLLSEPTVLTKSGEQGILEAVRVFPYPISFDPPELVTQNNNNVNFGAARAGNPPTIVPTTPTDFKRRNVGVRLVIKPQITSDNRTIDLSLFPEVTDFEGFINYGSPIFVGNPDGSQSLLTNNIINQPVFNTRRINTKVLIRDGSTVVLGGLIRDDLQNINDKVPVLGDLPLIGRLFQSKAVQNNKRNLIIFVSANIYRTDGELLNPPEATNTADLLTGHGNFNTPATP